LWKPCEIAVLTPLCEALDPFGLNLVGVAAVARYDAGVPPRHALGGLARAARSAIVVGNGGGALWRAFLRFRADRPEVVSLADPLDAYVEHAVTTAVRGTLGPAALRVLYPFRFPADPVSFQHLAACAGLGRQSRLGVLIHPTYGPWIALRAAVLVAGDVAAARPADGFDPCPGCVEQACMRACPAGAVRTTGWDVPVCAAHRRREDDPCATRCHARFDCVIGREHRYPDDAQAYHQHRARPALIARA
jgi:epoxyqueuosine reductase